MKKLHPVRSDFPSDAIHAFGAAIREGDQPGATDAYREIKPYLTAVAATYCRNPAEWPRFEQAALLAVARASQRFIVTRAKPLEHLIRVAVKNAALDELRKDANRVCPTEIDVLDDLLDPAPSPSELFIQTELRSHIVEQVRAWLKSRPQRERNFFDLHFVEGLSQVEIAQRLQVSRAAISKLRSTTLERARVELRHVQEFLSVN